MSHAAFLETAAAVAPAPPDLRGEPRYELTATGWVDGKLIEPITFPVTSELAAMFILAARPEGETWVVTGRTGNDLVTYRLRIRYDSLPKGKR